MLLKNARIGHQAPRGFVVNQFNSIEINGYLNSDKYFAYCKSHNFVFNVEEEEEKLYNAEPCFYTDNRYSEGKFNFYHNCLLHWTRWKNISLKSCIRKTLKCRNIPVGTIVSFKKSWYYPKKNFKNGYNFIVKRENRFDPQYQINGVYHSDNNFTSCERSQNLVNDLRANGFIVAVYVNTNRLTDMLNTAIAFTGSKDFKNPVIDGEIAIAYGFGKKIGFSSFNNDFNGYSNGCENILWDNWGEFDKWSRCNVIYKSTPIKEIIEILKQKKS